MPASRRSGLWLESDRVVALGAAIGYVLSPLGTVPPADLVTAGRVRRPGGGRGGGGSVEGDLGFGAKDCAHKYCDRPPGCHPESYAYLRIEQLVTGRRDVVDVVKTNH